MGEGSKKQKSEGKWEGGHVKEVWIRGEQCCLIFTFVLSPVSQLMCVFQYEYTDGLPYANTGPLL